MNNFRIVQAAFKLRQCSPAFGLQCRSMAQNFTPRSAASSKTNSEHDITNEPIQFFGSQAASWRAKDTRRPGSEDELSYQPYVISGSLAIFLLYFCVLREENDIDQKLVGNLYDHVPALEEVQLSLSYKHNKQHGIDNREVIKRLTEMGVDIKQLDMQIAEGK